MTFVRAQHREAILMSRSLFPEWSAKQNVHFVPLSFSYISYRYRLRLNSRCLPKHPRLLTRGSSALSGSSPKSLRSSMRPASKNMKFP